MAIYRYLGGSRTAIGDREFSFVGQQAEFTERDFRDFAAGGAVFVPEDIWDGLGITQESVNRFQLYPEMSPDAEDLEKIESGRDHFRETYRLLRAGLPI